jgi:hypothetical protein
MEATPNASEVAAPRVLVWVAHMAVCLLGALAARLSRTGAMLELHITGRDGAALAPDHVRQILTAPTTEFKAISLIGVMGALLFAVLLRKQGPRGLRAATFVITAVSALIYVAGYGIG